MAAILVGVTSLAAGTYLTSFAIERSWYIETPAGETEPRMVFRPYVALLIPGLALLGTGACGVAAVLPGLPKSGKDRRRPFFLATGSVNLAFGIAMFIHGLNYSFFIQCSDPGGCQELVLPFWPAFLPGIVMIVVGLFSVRFGMRNIPDVLQP